MKPDTETETRLLKANNYNVSYALMDACKEIDALLEACKDARQYLRSLGMDGISLGDTLRTVIEKSEPQ